MNTVAISLGIKTWIPYPGKKIKKVDPEMIAKVTKPKGSARGKGNADDGKRNRAAVLACLKDGQAHKLAEIAHAAGISDSTAKRHLVEMMQENIVMSNVGSVIISRKNPLLFWIAK